MMKRWFLFGVVALLAACGGRNTFPSAVQPIQGFSNSSVLDDLKTAHQNVYWTLFAGSADPQVQFAKVPLSKKSKATSIFYNNYNLLAYSSGMHVDKLRRLWILYFGPYNGNPGSAAVFKPPLTAKSSPLYRFVLEGTSDPDHLTFDASGNLWVNSHSNSSVIEYTGPFNQGGLLSPALTLTKGISNPSGIALDKSGNLYVSNDGSRGKNSIAIFRAPIANNQPKYLQGASAPGGLIFDKHGNLYASDNTSTLNAIVRYNSSDLKPGSKPSIVDKTGLPKQSYEADFALSAKGDLYLANCGNAGSAGVDVYPTSTKPFTSKLAPSVIYGNSYVSGVGCAWGIAIR
jgi:hypothetical protein